VFPYISRVRYETLRSQYETATLVAANTFTQCWLW